MITKQQASEIVGDLGFSLNPLQFYVGTKDTGSDGFLYIGYTTGETNGAGGVLCKLRGNDVYQSKATVAQTNSPVVFVVFDETLNANLSYFAGYRMKI